MLSKYRLVVAGIALMLLTLGGLAVPYVWGAGGNYLVFSRLMLESFKAIYEDYTDEVDLNKLFYGAVRGMCQTLDPHTSLMEPKQLKMLQDDTRGNFEGIGIQIGMSDAGANGEKWLMVISPIEGTPSYKLGIKPGDLIVKINGKTTKGFTTEDAINLLRGPKGTTVDISVKRDGERELLDYTITRDVIPVHSVPYYGVLKGNIGYVRLNRFDENSSKELTEALTYLKSKDVDGLIFDLRGNPGGLLNQAVEVSNLFLPRNSLIVYTQGRRPGDLREFNAMRDPIWPADRPVVTLVDRGSASASEIVSGAIQDHDRGIIMGETTFGKGLVQNVRQLNDSTALKLTTAKYYIPSHRCIQKENYFGKNSAIIRPETVKPKTADPSTDAFDEEDPEVAAIAAMSDTSGWKVDSSKVFYTDGGRKVFGGGGINPDIIAKPVYPVSRLLSTLFNKNIFFNFALQYTAKHKDIPYDFKVNDEMMREFRDFLKEKKFEWTSLERIQVDSLEAEMVRRDSTFKARPVYQAMKKFREELIKEEEKEYQIQDSWIRQYLKMELATNLWHDKGRYERWMFEDDPVVLKAADLLNDPKEYKKAIKGK